MGEGVPLSRFHINVPVASDRGYPRAVRVTLDETTGESAHRMADIVLEHLGERRSVDVRPSRYTQDEDVEVTTVDGRPVIAAWVAEQERRTA